MYGISAYDEASIDRHILFDLYTEMLHVYIATGSLCVLQVGNLEQAVKLWSNTGDWSEKKLIEEGACVWEGDRDEKLFSNLHVTSYK